MSRFCLQLVYCFCAFSGTCWSSYHKGLLASSDYEGTVTLWDAFTGVKNRSFQVRCGGDCFVLFSLLCVLFLVLFFVVFGFLLLLFFLLFLVLFSYVCFFVFFFCIVWCKCI